jgi:phasin family protein
MATAAETIVKDTVKTAEKTADKAKATTEQFATAGAKAFKESVEKSLAGLNELNSQSKQNLEAFVASATATAKGAESLNAQALAYGKTAVEKHVEAVKAMSSARSVQEVIELQTTYAKSAMETYLAEMNHASETFSTMMKTAFRPLNERATAAVESLQAAR